MSKLDLVSEFLRTENVAVLSTVNADGTPHATPMFYLPNEGPLIYWFSSQSSQHSRNLVRSPDAACAVFRPTDNWKQIRGVQMRGQARLINDRKLLRSIRTTYAERFHLTSTLRALMRRTDLFVFQPSWIRYLDNTVRFGYKFTIKVLSMSNSQLTVDLE